MNDLALISVVLPVYNGERYLSGAIESVLAQTYPHWELIIVDDASTDNTPIVAQQYAEKDTRICYIRHEHNKKLPAALNTGFLAACGQFFTWTSDDNLYRPHALETLYGFLNEHPQIDIVYSDYTLIDDVGNPIQRIVVQEPRFLARKAVVGASFLYRRKVQEALNGYDENLFLAEDYDFWLRASMQFSLAALHEDLYMYRWHSGALTSRKRQAVMQLREQLLLRHLPNLRWADSVDLARGYLHLGEVAHELGSNRRKYKYHFTALRYNIFVVLRYYSLRLSPQPLRRRLIKLYQRLRGIT